MSSMLRLCFLKYPPTKIQYNQPFQFSLTIYNDLGVGCGEQIEDISIKLKLIQVKDIQSTTDGNNNNRSIINKIQLNLMEPKKNIINNNNDNEIDFKFQANSPYIEYNFMLMVNNLQKSSITTSIQLSFEVIDNINNNIILPGGSLVKDLYFLNLYSNIIEISNKVINNSNTTTIDDNINLSLRYFNFKIINKEISNRMIVLESTFGQDLGSHCWDCSWIGLHFLTSILLSNNNIDYTNNNQFKLKNELYINKLKEKILPSNKKQVTLLELGCGCGLLSQGLYVLLSKINIKYNNKYQFYLSDLPQILNKSTKRNLTINNIDYINNKNKNKNMSIDLLSLDWELDIELNQFELPDIIVAFDVIYNNETYLLLIRLLKNIIKLCKDKNKETMILIGYKKRNSLIENQFFKLIQENFELFPILSSVGLYLLMLIPK
ncbi:hypothetical protein K502DRAFT_366159 [Neoconidiobolus thromboides FSU 785]|nr:hypothetical protein K502DRAFT_366159 [Neoconidiobolus thromboides FSU 785]